MALGTGCGECERCKREISRMRFNQKTSEIAQLFKNAGVTAAQAIQNFCDAAEIDVSEVQLGGNTESSSHARARGILDDVEKVFEDNNIFTETEDIRAVSVLVVKQIDTALTDYGRESFELQNMDGEFRFWDKVLNKIKVYDYDK